MRKIAMTLAALTLAMPLVAHAEAGNVETGKNRCLLYSENCPEQSDTIFEKIDKLQKEMARGIYSQAEIFLLERKLEEYRGLLDSLMSGGE
jgi:hypothetical protein